MALPKFIFLKSNDNNKYLCYNKEQGPDHAGLRFSLEEKDETAEIQYFKFEVEVAKVKGMIHIRSCYNHKYLVKNSADSNLIAGEANEPEEDESKWTCTLFKPILADPVDEDAIVPHDEPLKIRLLHIDQHHEQYTTIDQGGDLVVVNQEDARSASSDVFTVYDARSAVILPRHVAIMGHNDEYCSITTMNNVNYLEFKTKDIGAWGVLNEVHSYPIMNLVCLTNKVNDRFWSLTAGVYITVGNSVTYLRPTRLGGNEIALTATENGRFVNCASGSGMEHVLGATASSISEYARFRVMEAVLLREVKDVVYNTDDARVYNVGEVSVYSDTRSNLSSVEQNGSFAVSYTKTETMRWSDSVSIATGLSASMTFSIPYVGEFGVELSREETQTREWGEETIKEEKVEYGQNLNILPMTRLTLMVLATRASCDVPFVCEVSDTLADGRNLTYTKTDGLFVGSNGYGYRTKIIEEKI